MGTINKHLFSGDFSGTKNALLLLVDMPKKKKRQQPPNGHPTHAIYYY